MSHDDDRLDALLRDIPVPPELHAQLLQLCEEKPTPRPQVTGPRIHSKSLRHRTRWLLRPRAIVGTAAAAVLLILATWSWWWPEPEPGTRTADRASQPDIVAPDSPPTAVADQLEAIEAQLRDVLVQLEHLELARQHARLTRLVPPRSAIDPDHAKSLTRYLAAESAMDWGLDAQAIRPDMEAIIARYPNTTGADRARQFLSRIGSN